MFETTLKYSEEQFCTKEDVEKDFQNSTLETVWQQIQEYRKMFQKVFVINYHTYRIVLNPYVLKEMEKTWMELKRFPQTSELYPENCTKAQENYIRLMEEDVVLTPSSFSYYLDKFDIHLTKEWIDFIIYEECSIYIKLYVLRFLNDLHTTNIVMFLYLKFLRLPTVYTIFKYTEEIFSKNGSFTDITSEFLSYLKKIRLKLSNGMLSLYSERKSDLLILHEQVLMERHPHLTSKQVRFYVTHRDSGHYYAITQYIQETGVCYETARKSLDELVQEKWYAKRKMGKKFVYYIATDRGD